MFRILAKVIVWFIAISVGLTLVYRFVPPPLTLTMVFDSHGFTKDWVPLSRIDRDMVDAAIAAEDSKFCSHKRNEEGGRLRGGSTISQQTAKNVFLWQGEGWTRYVRKGLEVWFTFLIEHIWGKRRIMEVYLNVAETGLGTYGVEAGAQRYYNSSAANLSPTQAARIAAILPSPKTREVNGAGGFTRRYGNTIAARIGTVRRSGYDSCVYD